MTERKTFKSNSVTDADIIAIAMEAGFEGRHNDARLSGKSNIDELLYVDEYPVGEMLFKFSELLLMKAGIFPGHLVNYYRVWVIESLVDEKLSMGYEFMLDKEDNKVTYKPLEATEKYILMKVNKEIYKKIDSK